MASSAVPLHVPDCDIVGQDRGSFLVTHLDAVCDLVMAYVDGGDAA
ncbi:hypothetical protein ACQP2T_47065 [Nonomuraea sp. CA-143628]